MFTTKKLQKILFFIALIIISNYSVLTAETIQKVNITGNKRIDNIYILSIISSKENTEYNIDIVNNDIKRMYSTELFEKIDFNFDNGTLTINIIENLQIANIVIQGNSKIKEDVITKEMLTKSRSNFSQNKLNLDIQRISDMYYRSGFLTASVSYKIIEKEANIIDIEINIIENVKNVIKKINFIGNNNFSKKSLESVMMTKEDKWWRFMNAGNVYDKNRINYDAELLKQFYFENGYPTFSVISTTAEISPITNEFEITYVISEGEKYKFGEVNFVIDISDMVQHENKFLKIAKFNQNDWFKASEVQEKLFLLNEEIKRLKYQFVAVSERLSFNETLKTVNVSYVISQEPRLFIDKIETKGNTKTKDYVLRRALKFNEGDDFTTTKANIATRNLYKTQFFGNVQIQDVSSKDPGKVSVIVNVEERPTGSIQAGGGYSTIDRFSLNAKYSDTNIFGTGKSVDVYFDVNSYNTSYGITYGNPYFLDRELYGSIGVARVQSSNLFGYNTGRNVNRESNTITVAVGHNITNNLSQRVSYQLSYQTFTALTEQRLQQQKNRVDKRTTSSITNYFTLDTTDNAVYPTKGLLSSLSTEYMGLGGDTYYLRNGIKTIFYQKIYNKVVFSSLFGAYAVTPTIRKTISTDDLEVLNDRELRGFTSSSGVPVGPYIKYPQDVTQNIFDDTFGLGGKYKFRGSFQLQMPFPGNTNYSLIVYLFNDYATVTNFTKEKTTKIDTVGSKKIQNDSIRSSYGFGLTWASPLGIIKIGLGWPLMYKSTDGLQKLFLDFGTEF